MNRAILMILAGAALIGAAIALSVGVFTDGDSGDTPPATIAAGPEPAPAPPPAAAPAPSAPAPSAAAPAKPQPDVPEPAATAPSFDVVRVNPQGDTVIAGRAAPGAEVTIKDGDTVIGTATADRRGEWVYVPDKPLDPGSRQLELSARASDGTVSVGERSVVLVIPEREKDVAGRPADEPSSPLALSVPRAGSGPSQVLQAPSAVGPGGIAPRPGSASAPPVAAPGQSASRALSLDVVDYDERGQLILSGRGPAGARVLSYLDGQLLGRADAGDDERWTLQPEKPVAPGLYTLRVDQVRDDGSVVARLQFPFSRAAPVAGLKPEQFVVVQPGNSLWRISRRTYGRGLAYTVIYEANDDQIRDPDLIYPGQVFVLPPAGAAQTGG